MDKVTAHRAVELLNERGVDVVYSTVISWIKRGKLPAEKFANKVWMIDPADLEGVEVGRAGRPKETKKGEG